MSAVYTEYRRYFHKMKIRSIYDYFAYPQAVQHKP